MISLSPVRAGYSIVIFLPAATVPSSDFPVVSLSMIKLLLSAWQTSVFRPFDCAVLQFCSRILLVRFSSRVECWF
jgi:hypothetical protein